MALRQNVRVAEQAVTAARQQVDEDQQHVELGAMTPIDVLSAQSELASVRVQLVAAQSRLQQQEVTLRALISRVADPALDAAVIEPTDPLPFPNETDIPSLRDSINAALANRSSIRQAELSLQNQHIAVDYTRKNLLPTLSVYGSMNLYGLAPETSLAFRQLIRWAYRNTIRRHMVVPVFNRSAQADDVRARLESQESQAALLRTRQQVTVQVQNATAGVVQNRARVNASQRALVGQPGRILRGRRNACASASPLRIAC